MLCFQSQKNVEWSRLTVVLLDIGGQPCGTGHPGVEMAWCLWSFWRSSRFCYRATTSSYWPRCGWGGFDFHCCGGFVVSQRWRIFCHSLGEQVGWGLRWPPEFQHGLLTALCSPHFEPLAQAAFLLAITSAKRVGELHTLSINQFYLHKFEFHL